jgi:hypothetical protein
MPKENSGWTVKTLKEYLLRLLEEHDQRHERSKVEAKELRDSQRNEINIAIQGVEKLLAAAIDANREAVTKVEIANEKRFEGVNEFRGQLSDQQSHFVTRVELDGIKQGVAKQFELFGTQLRDLQDRMNRDQGKGVGLNAGWQYLIAVIAAAGAMLVIWKTLHP